jgi:hypothetical protein
MSPAELTDYVEHFRQRVLADALQSATADYHRRRADAFESAIPRAGDYTGNATPEAIEAARYRNAAIVLACRRHAEVMLGGQL